MEPITASTVLKLAKTVYDRVDGAKKDKEQCLVLKITTSRVIDLMFELISLPSLDLLSDRYKQIPRSGSPRKARRQSGRR
jgi:hypothetical protein